jgi:putative oxidoreductase
LNFLNRLHPLGLLVLRLALGVVMIAHGYQNLFGGMAQFTGMLSHIGIPPWMGYLTVAAEFGGGMLLVFGFLTRLAAACHLH